MKLAVVGSRDFTDFDYCSRVLDIFVKKFNVTKIISGGARGTDRMAIKYAKKNNISWKEYLPQTQKYGIPTSFFIRNQSIVDDSEMLVAFWNKQSTGTADSIKKAKKKGIKVYVIQVRT